MNFRNLLAIATLATLVACGYKGPLYLPKQPHQNPAPATNNSFNPTSATPLVESVATSKLMTSESPANVSRMTESSGSESNVKSSESAG